MRKYAYLARLEELLAALPAQERQDALNYYEEYFDAAGSENEEQTAAELGADYGQERLAPEVNRHNMLVLTEHLRKLGYKIPDSYDENIKNMPKNYTNILRESYQDVYAADDPLSKAFSNVMSNFEDGLGLDFQNILFNTMDLLGTD